MGMARNQVDCHRITASIRVRTGPRKQQLNFNNSFNDNFVSPPRRYKGSQQFSPRTSPGLLAGHYAGCKFSEPPLPSSLPLPPERWTAVKHCALERVDVTQRLKTMLKVQA